VSVKQSGFGCSQRQRSAAAETESARRLHSLAVIFPNPESLVNGFHFCVAVAERALLVSVVISDREYVGVQNYHCNFWGKREC